MFLIVVGVLKMSFNYGYGGYGGQRFKKLPKKYENEMGVRFLPLTLMQEKKHVSYLNPPSPLPQVPVSVLKNVESR